MSEQKAVSLRDKIRSKTLGVQPVFKTRSIQYDGMEIELREPNISQWGDLIKQARNKDETINIGEFMVRLVLYCSYVPGTDELVFEEGDYAKLKKQPRSGFVAQLSDVATALITLDQSEAVKN